MCEIFFQYSVNGDSIDKSTLQTLLQQAQDASRRNDDGWGVFDAEGNTYKTASKFDEDDAEVAFELFKDSQFVVLHLRMATTGSVCHENTHPFTYEHDDGSKEVLVHNGVIRHNGNDVAEQDDETDSMRVLRAIAESDEDSTPKRVESVMEDVRGTSSIFLLDREDNLYYFRRNASFNLAYDRDTGDLIGATKEKRLDAITTQTELNFFERTRDGVTEIETPDSRRIYRITDDGIFQVGSWRGQSNGRYTGYDPQPDDDEEDEDDTVDEAAEVLADNPELPDHLWNDYPKPGGEPDPSYESGAVAEELWYDEQDGMWRDVYGNPADVPVVDDDDHFDDLAYHEALQQVHH